MLQVISDITGELSDCTMETGIVGCDGVRRGAIADIDLFGSFTLEGRLTPKRVGTLGQPFDVWSLMQRTDKVVVNRQASKVAEQDGKIGVDELARRVAAGRDLWDADKMADCGEDE